MNSRWRTVTVKFHHSHAESLHFPSSLLHFLRSSSSVLSSPSISFRCSDGFDFSSVSVGETLFSLFLFHPSVFVVQCLFISMPLKETEYLLCSHGSGRMWTTSCSVTKHIHSHTALPECLYLMRYISTSVFYLFVQLPSCVRWRFIV